MTIVRRLGADSILLAGVQSDRNTQVTQQDKMIPRQLLFSNLGLSQRSTVVENPNIRGGGVASKPVPGQLYADGTIESGMTPDTIGYFLYALFNPASVPSSTRLYTKRATDASAAVTFAHVAVDGTVTGNAAANDEKKAADTNRNPFPDEHYDFGYPSRILVGNAADTGKTLKIKGYGRIGAGQYAVDNFEYQEEEIDLTTASAVSKYFYQTIELAGITKGGTTGDYGGAFDLKFDPQLYETLFQFPLNRVIFPGWTLQISRGGVPEVGVGCVPDNLSITVGDAITASMNIRAKKVTPFRQFDTGNAEKLVLDDHFLRIGKAANAALYYKGGSDDFNAAWGTAIDFGDVRATGTALTLNIDQSAADGRGFDGSRFRPAPTYGQRICTAEMTTFYETGSADTDDFTKWSEVYIRNQTEPVKVGFYNFTETGQLQLVEYSATEAGLTEAPVVEVNTAEDLEQSLNFQFYPSSASNQELEVRVLNSTAFDQPMP